MDRSAPVLAHHEIDVAVPLDVVWVLFADVGAWPAWQTDITEARADGALAPGASFHWTSSRTARASSGGTAGGTAGIHEWTFRETPEGVRVTTDESFAGAPVEADASSFRGCSTSRRPPGCSTQDGRGVAGVSSPRSARA